MGCGDGDTVSWSASARRTAHTCLLLYRLLMYNICIMRKRMNIIVEDDDQTAMAVIRRVYGLPSDTAAIRFALRKLMREEEGLNRVHGEQRRARRSTQ